MISRPGRLAAFGALAVVCATLTSACQKVPLLAPSGSIITLLATTSALPVNGSTNIVAQLIEPSGTPPQRGTLVTFTTTLGRIEPAEAETDVSGRAVVKFIASGGSGVATISAISGGVAVVAANALRIAVGTAAVGGITVSASPTSLGAAGGTSTIVATVMDANGNPLGNVPVTFSTDNGTLGSTTITTDASGNAQTVLTTSRTAKVTATAGVTTTTTTGGTTTTTAPSGTVTVTVNVAASIAFTAFTPSPAVAGQPVTFTLTITPPATGGGSIRQVIVDFGDGTTQALGAVQGATPLSHTYNRPGVYTLTATVTDSNGDQFVGLASVSVANRPGLAVTISASANPRVNTPTTFTIAATPSTGNTITSIRVDFGDGESVTLPGNATTVQHVFTSGGPYTVTATANDSSGATGSGSTVIVVAGTTSGTVTATFTPTPATGTVNSTNFQFSASASSTNGTIANSSYVWDFGDPTSSTNTGMGPTQSHVYVTTGTKTITLTVTDSNQNSTTTTRTVIVS